MSSQQKDAKVAAGTVEILIENRGRRFLFQCKQLVEGFAVDPVLPREFDCTPNDGRTDRDLAWWDVPFIRTTERFGANLQYGRDGFEVRCLDGGAWDRSTYLGWADSVERAVEIAKAGSVWKRGVPAVYPVVGTGVAA